MVASFIKKGCFVLLVFFVLMMGNGVYANPSTSLPTYNSILKQFVYKMSVNNDNPFMPENLMTYLLNPFGYYKEILLYVLPVFLLTFLVIYAVLSEIEIFERTDLLMPISAVISIIAVVSGIVGYVAFVVSNFIAIGILGLFLGVVYLGGAAYYKRKLKQFGYSGIYRNMFYVFITHLPLVVSLIIVFSTAWYYIFNDLPLTGAKGVLWGALVGAVLLSLRFD